MDMKTILAIGNSFSQDATHYLHRIAEAGGVDLKTVNLYIGGCSLERHYNNMKTGAKDYLLEIDGTSTGRYVSIAEALDMEDWDYIVTQQVSGLSGLRDTYEPYLGELLRYLAAEKPRAERMLHETWAYETDSDHPDFAKYGNSRQKMHEMLSRAYRDEAEKYALRVIPSGDVIAEVRKKEPFLYENGGRSLCRDGFHMDYIYGRYLLGAVWYKTLTGKTLSDNGYLPKTPFAPDAVCDEEVLNVIRETVDTFMI